MGIPKTTSTSIPQFIHTSFITSSLQIVVRLVVISDQRYRLYLSLQIGIIINEYIYCFFFFKLTGHPLVSKRLNNQRFELIILYLKQTFFCLRTHVHTHTHIIHVIYLQLENPKLNDYNIVLFCGIQEKHYLPQFNPTLIVCRSNNEGHLHAAWRK